MEKNDNSYPMRKEVLIKLKGKDIAGSMEIPANAKGLVIFAHGSGSSRFSPRNRYVAGILNKNNLGTLLFDLLTAEEEKIDEYTAEYRFNVQLLAERLINVTDWLLKEPSLKGLKLGYFGASTGAAAALIAAAKKSDIIYAVVSRGGRPDLAMESLSEVKAPTLLIVGGEDFEVIELNKAALENITAKKKLEIIPGATHLFEEPGALEEVARITAKWFIGNL
ncbi:MAG: alpha/beta hydrolase [Deltaproteobacteria bacterium]|jgi:dienelactone hydrolase|nr:alpha/beta hydrolase [Deltaproteobacteria bacterium]MCL5879236.1 alpha/beta hydrolase [Deltaproteobacteria bacterium]MDA8304981.1 alpha/beta hydrolase [Deltaproteobacteria bacterium]